MSRHLINEYRAELDRLRAVTGSTRETNLRPAFARLLRAWGKHDLDLVFVEEHQIRTPQGNLISVDGALVHALRVPFGYWEAKDERDDLDAEIAAKFRKGYPKDNIVFSDDRTAVLYQDGTEAGRVPMQDTEALYGLLARFFAHERQEIADFNKAVKQFAADLPAILVALRDRIAEKHAQSQDFANAVSAFLKHAQDAINPAVTEDDVREMLIQHVLTEDIFAKVFDNPDFHQHNNIAAELKKVEDALFGPGEKAQLLRALAPYYSGIASTAALISSHSEKQGFLKALYEDFYKAYNKRAADRLGVVYTPGEIVRFMIRSADWLCEKHFGKNLIDPGVEILDPATGTGTFIVELLEHFRGNHEKLRHKYKEELHANEVAVLPYYVANLNIEATYQAILSTPGKLADYEEFKNLCFVDTIDNAASLNTKGTHYGDLLGGISVENVARIERQNSKNISLVICNPPYNAHQDNIRDENPNRKYPVIDRMIKSDYVRSGTAQLSVNYYDMYLRFLKWASLRIGENGMICFVSNSSFIHKNSLDGVRSCIESEFNQAWIVDLKGDARTSGENRRKQGGNIFGDNVKVGIAVYILVKGEHLNGFKLFYDSVDDYADANQKTSFIDRSVFERHFEEIKPDKHHGWVGQPADQMVDTLSLASKGTRATQVLGQERAIFKSYALGVSSNRDDWVYDKSKSNLVRKVRHLLREYRQVKPSAEPLPATVKWSETLEKAKRSNRKEGYDGNVVRRAAYRPFSKRWLYQSDLLIDRPGASSDLFPPGATNIGMCFTDKGARTDFIVQAVDGPADLHFGAAVDAYQQVARYRYAKSGERIDNITDWALDSFAAHYGKKDITKDAIFYYVYAVLHDPVYLETYALNLKREFPRIPFYPDFAKWVGWGETLMAMHIGYEEVESWPVERIDEPSTRAEGTHPKPILRSEPDKGAVIVDADTQITGIPSEAWNYRLGNRSAIDWVLDQHKEKRPRDPTVAAKFNTYRFADYKESMIALLAKVVRVSVETVAITEAMKALGRSAWEKEE